VRKPEALTPKGQKRFRFSKEKIEALAIPKDGPAIFYDCDVKGLCLRVQPSGKKLFFVLKKAGGKTHRRSLSTFPEMTVENARKHAHSLLAAVADWIAGDRQDPCPLLRPLPDLGEGPLSLNTAFQQYLKSPGKKVKKLSDPVEKAIAKEKADARRQYIFDHCFKELADYPIEQLTPTFLTKYHERLSDKYSPIMMNKAHEIIRAVFNYLIRRQLWTKVNPAIGVERAAKNEREIILEADQGQAFFDALDADPNRDFAEWVALLLLTGVRTSNLYSATWKELKLSRKPPVWEIPPAKSKNGKLMAIPLSKKAVSLLKGRAARLHPGVELKDLEGWVFPSHVGSDSGHIQDYKNQWRRLLKNAGLKNFVRHDLRRTFITRMIAAGVPLPVVAAASGHSNLVSLTPYLRHYAGDVAKAVETGDAEMNKRIEEAEAEKKQLTA
jgi:integrase